ncbi:MAG TPA: transporter [Gammaproteobacteria bacterium]|nr:transporter [Gammaproteobacteria bacterium]
MNKRGLIRMCFILLRLAAASLALYLLTGHAADVHDHHDSTAHDHFGTEPIGVMGAHLHGPGDWMISLRAMRMDMDGNRDGTRRMSPADVFSEGYMVAPEHMTMDMQMPGVMYGISTDLTVMLMLPRVELEMDHVTAAGARFTTRSSGIGDVRLSGLYRLGQWGMHQLNLNAGISVPTGSINEKDDTPMGANQHLPCPMQPGSGPRDLMPGLTLLGQETQLSWGLQGIAVLRLGENDNDYTPGDRCNLTGWITRTWAPDWLTSLRLDGQWWGDIEGSDRKIPPMMARGVPTADPDLRGGRRVDLLLGAAFTPRAGLLRGQRLGVEYGRPVYQNLDGPQLETDWTVTLGWQLLL